MLRSRAMLIIIIVLLIICSYQYWSLPRLIIFLTKDLGEIFSCLAPTRYRHVPSKRQASGPAVRFRRWQVLHVHLSLHLYVDFMIERKNRMVLRIIPTSYGLTLLHIFPYSNVQRTEHWSGVVPRGKHWGHGPPEFSKI
jgi:hypothetical protein